MPSLALPVAFRPCRKCTHSWGVGGKAKHSKPKGSCTVRSIPPDQDAVFVTAPTAVPSLSDVSVTRCTVSYLSKSVVGKSARYVLWVPEAGLPPATGAGGEIPRVTRVNYKIRSPG